MLRTDRTRFHKRKPILLFDQKEEQLVISVALADLGEGVPGARLPIRDPILLFSHTFLPKRTCVGGPCLPLTGPRPPTENPGSATEWCSMCVSGCISADSSCHCTCGLLLLHSQIPESKGNIIQ